MSRLDVRRACELAEQSADRFLARLIGAALDDLDMHPALHACAQLALAGPHPAAHTRDVAAAHRVGTQRMERGAG